jgi:peptidoglycan hydrolase-like protein with peptidoglycan-binding domain
MFNQPGELKAFREIALRNLEENEGGTIPPAHRHLLKNPRRPDFGPLGPERVVDKFLDIISFDEEMRDNTDWLFMYLDTPGYEWHGVEVMLGDLRADWRRTFNEFLARPACCRAQVQFIDDQYLRPAREAAREMGLQSVRAVGLLADIQIAHGTIPAHVRTRRNWPNYQTASERHRIDIIVDAYGNSPWFERHRNVAGGLPLDAYPFEGPHVRSHVAVGVPVVPERIEVSGPVPIARIEGEEIPEAAPHPTLRPGDYGNDVSLLQRLLADRGFMRDEEIDGILRDATEAALRTFQKQNRLTEDGVAGPETWAALSPVLEPGDRGPAVKKLQAALNEVEDADLDVDGIFGRETRRAVRAVQRESGIPADGVVGPETRRHLEADLTYDTWPALGPGMQGPEVETLQQFLADRRLLTPGDVDGDFGPATERAIRTLQDGLGLNVDGYTDESVWKALVFEVSLGDRGPVVRALQRELNDKWNADLRIDGVFNHETDRSVRSFQLAHKLKVDGVAGALTWRRLISYIPEPAPFIQPGEQPQPQL